MAKTLTIQFLELDCHHMLIASYRINDTVRKQAVSIGGRCFELWAYFCVKNHCGSLFQAVNLVHVEKVIFINNHGIISCRLCSSMMISYAPLAAS